MEGEGREEGVKEVFPYTFTGSAWIGDGGRGDGLKKVKEKSPVLRLVRKAAGMAGMSRRTPMVEPVRAPRAAGRGVRRGTGEEEEGTD